MEHPGPVPLGEVDEAHTGIIVTLRTPVASGEIIRGMPGAEKLLAD